MKNFNNKTFLIVLLLCSIFSFGCKKDNPFSNTKVLSSYPDEIQELYGEMPVRNYSSIQVIGDGILKFQSLSHYDTVCNQLKRDCELWSNLFYNYYSELSENELIDWEEEVSFDEFLPIIIFESDLAVSNLMLFDIQRIAIAAWEENGLQGNNPTDSMFIFEWEQALYNVHKEICIDDTIYQFRPDAIILIPIDSLDSWTQIRDYPTEELTEHGGIVVLNNYSTYSSSVHKMLFPCHADGTLDVSNYPELFTGINNSKWIVSGRMDISKRNRLDSKLTNYIFHHYKNNGTPVFRRTRRTCSIITSSQTFFCDHYHGLFDFPYEGTTEEYVTKPLPPQRFVRTATGSVYVFIPRVFSVEDKYDLGVYREPTLSFSIEISGEHNFSIYLLSGRP